MDVERKGGSNNIRPSWYAMEYSIIALSRVIQILRTSSLGPKAHTVFEMDWAGEGRGGYCKISAPKSPVEASDLIWKWRRGMHAGLKMIRRLHQC